MPMPKINLRLTDEEHALLKEWAFGSRRSIQREAVFRIFDNTAYEGQEAAQEKARDRLASKSWPGRQEAPVDDPHFKPDFK